MNSYVNMILFYSFVFFLINLEFWVLLLGLCEQCHEALCVRNNTSSFCKLLATNSLQTQTSNSQRPVPHACSALCWQKAGPAHPGLSADQRSSVWRWKFRFFLTSDLFVEHVSTTVHHQKELNRGAIGIYFCSVVTVRLGFMLSGLQGKKNGFEWNIFLFIYSICNLLSPQPGLTSVLPH